MKKMLSALAGLSLVVAPVTSAAASVRPASAVPMYSSSVVTLDDHMDESDDDELFILAIMGGALILAALTIFDGDDSQDDFFGSPISGA